MMAVYAPGCGSADDEHQPDPKLRGVVYELGTNEDALMALVSASAQSNVPSAPTLVRPTRGADVPAAPTLTFSWKPGTTALASPLSPTRLTH